ncbi:hypothetical protein M8818_006269 [Zalaria obscura]|uniref:Uncharacterized protein n=1 Tax=Zalaria obscura TaxID=2024903 RepID=A0ACC3S8E0_9PEZI
MRDARRVPRLRRGTLECPGLAPVSVMRVRPELHFRDLPGAVSKALKAVRQRVPKRSHETPRNEGLIGSIRPCRELPRSRRSITGTAVHQAVLLSHYSLSPKAKDLPYYTHGFDASPGILALPYDNRPCIRNCTPSRIIPVSSGALGSARDEAKPLSFLLTLAAARPRSCYSRARRIECGNHAD